MSYILEHTRLYWCWYDIIALVILAAVIVLYIVKVKKLKKEQKELEELAAAKADLPKVEET